MNFLLVNLRGIISLWEMFRTLVMITIYAASAKKAMLRDAWIEKMKKTSQNSKALISICRRLKMNVTTDIRISIL